MYNMILDKTPESDTFPPAISLKKSSLKRKNINKRNTQDKYVSDAEKCVKKKKRCSESFLIL